MTGKGGEPVGQERRELARLFIALDLPATTREGIAAWGGRALSDPALRAVRPESLHITLAFLGPRPLDEIEAIAAVVSGSAVPAPWLELREPVPRPARRPSLYALAVRSPAAESLQAGLQERLVAAGLHQPAQRPFWPHVTIARVRSEGRGSRRPAPVQKPPRELPAALRQPFRSVRMSFYRSVLQPQGARYVPLAQVELPAGRQ